MNLKQEVNLAGEWRFEIGDKPSYAEPDFNDSQWEKIKVPGVWENQGFPGYDGFAWYRITFFVPKNLKGRLLCLKLGRIDDVDQVFLNGKKVGQHGRFPPAYETAYDVKRLYTLSEKSLKFGQKNVLAVRVFDFHGKGGIIGRRVGIYSRKDIVKLVLNLSGKWKFSTGDKKEWALSGFNDSKWKLIKVPSVWEKQGFPKYDGTAWYRKEVTIPGKVAADNLILMLGRINDIDEVYFNGKKIGSTGSFATDRRHKSVNKGAYKKERAYPIPSDLIQANRQNVIAVRVHDHGNLGGIYEGYIGIATRKEYLAYLKRKD